MTQINLRFPGQYLDQESNSHYNFHRNYQQNLGRYLQQDPIGLGGGVNNFLYANGNSIIFIDPSGFLYTRAECDFLMEFIDGQKRTLLVYEEMAKTGKKFNFVSYVNTATDGPDGCTIFPDEGRRKACEAHEYAHHSQVFSYFEFLGVIAIAPFDENALSRYKGKWEIMPTKTGIRTGEALYEENCKECLF